MYHFTWSVCDLFESTAFHRCCSQFVQSNLLFSLTPLCLNFSVDIITWVEAVAEVVDAVEAEDADAPMTNIQTENKT